MNRDSSILIIGGGRMGGVLAARWHMAGLGVVQVVEPDAVRREVLAASGIRCHETLQGVFGKPSVVVLAVKPQQFVQLRKELSDASIVDQALLISIMVGIPLATLEQLAPRAVRVMPNLPAMAGESMSVACAPSLDEVSRAAVMRLFEAVGKFAWVEDEQLLHATTAISGSGPGYLYAFMEALELAAMAQGLSPVLARQLVSQTMYGAALLADQSTETVATLRRNVTSPGGTTEAALEVFTSGNFDTLVGNAVAAAARRSRKLAES